MQSMDTLTGTRAAASGQMVVCDAADYHSGLRTSLITLLHKAEARGMVEKAEFIRGEVTRLDGQHGNGSGGIRGVQIAPSQ